LVPTGNRALSVSALDDDRAGAQSNLSSRAGSWRPLYELLAHTGLRIGEALGLTWADIDHANGLINVHRQLDRHRRHAPAPLKTPSSRREVVLAPGIGKLLREHWLASRYKDDAMGGTTSSLTNTRSW
jgi:integrase